MAGILASPYHFRGLSVTKGGHCLIFNQAANGCSDLLVEVFRERGVHARSALGASSLRGGLPVILKAVVEVAP